MTDGYCIVEWKRIKEQYPEFQKTMANLETQAIDMAVARWTGFKYDPAKALQPDEGESGRTTILPELFADENNDILDDNHAPQTWGVDNYRIYYTDTSPAAVAIPGWKTILQGGNPQNIGITREDSIIALAGYMIPDPTILISKLRMEIGSRRYPKIDIEEMHGYEQPALIFEEGYTIPEENHFLLKGFFEANGYQRVIPLGFCIFRRRDLFITE